VPDGGGIQIQHRQKNTPAAVDACQNFSCRLLILGCNLSSALKRPSESPKSLTSSENIGLNALQVLYVVKKVLTKLYRTE